MNPAQIPVLPGEKWRHPTENELFWDRDLGGEAPDTKNSPATQTATASANPPKFHGQYGFQAAGEQSSAR
jgi:hypothetical protein